MNNTFARRALIVTTVLLAAAAGGSAQQHRWAGRTLDDFEWAVHERLASLPFHGVFELLSFETQGKTVILSGEVLKETTKQRAERAVAGIDGVEKIINRIEVLPPSARDAVLRTNVYRAIYEHLPIEKYRMRAAPSIQIIVKDGWVSLEGVVDSDSDRYQVRLQSLRVTTHVSDHSRVAADEI